MFMCSECVHKNVCKNRERFEGSLVICTDYVCGMNHERYGNIYDMFQPIFEWMQKHYPSGEMIFIVDKSHARMLHEHKVAAYDRKIRESVTGKGFEQKEGV